MPVPKRRSFSQFKSYASCGMAYKLERIDGVPRRPAAWFTHGRAFHTAVEHYERSGRTATDEECFNVYDRLWEEEIGADLRKEPDLSAWMTGGRRKAETDLEIRKQEGKDQFVKYREYALRSGETIWTAPDGRLAVELEIEFEINGVPVIVFIDQVIVTPNGMLVVRDLKTGSSYNSPIQLALYDLALEARYGFRALWGDFWKAKNGGPTAPIPLASYTRERVGTWFAQMDQAEEAGIYLPNPSDTCARMCGVSQWCTAVGGTEYTAIKEVS